MWQRLVQEATGLASWRITEFGAEITTICMSMPGDVISATVTVLSSHKPAWIKYQSINFRMAVMNSLKPNKKGCDTKAKIAERDINSHFDRLETINRTNTIFSWPKTQTNTVICNKLNMSLMCNKIMKRSHVATSRQVQATVDEME